MRINEARHEGDITQVDARSARGWCGAGEVDGGDPAVVYQHEDRAIVEPFSVKETIGAYR
jgi:hypothetical protein